MQEADGECLDGVCVDEALNRSVGGVEVERRLNRALVADASGHLGAPVAGYHRRRVLEAQIEHVVAQLEAHVGDVHEPLGRQHAGHGAAALDDGIGHQRRAVDHGVDFRYRDVVLFQQRDDAVEHGGGGVGRRRQLLVDRHGVAGVLEQREVGEGAADVDPDAVGHGRSPMKSCRSRTLTLTPAPTPARTRSRLRGAL